jgi:hypothetical protein
VASFRVVADDSKLFALVSVRFPCGSGVGGVLEVEGSVGMYLDM